MKPWKPTNQLPLPPLPGLLQAKCRLSEGQPCNNNSLCSITNAAAIYPLQNPVKYLKSSVQFLARNVYVVIYAHNCFCSQSFQRAKPVVQAAIPHNIISNFLRFAVILWCNRSWRRPNPILAPYDPYCIYLWALRIVCNSQLQQVSPIERIYDNGKPVWVFRCKSQTG